MAPFAFPTGLDARKVLAVEMNLEGPQTHTGSQNSAHQQQSTH
jgi:hypothetical protein